MGVVYTTIRPRILRVFRHLLSLVTGESRFLFLPANDVCLLLQDVQRAVRWPGKVHATTSIPMELANLANSEPMFPVPTTPRVLPCR